MAIGLRCGMAKRMLVRSHYGPEGCCLRLQIAGLRAAQSGRSPQVARVYATNSALSCLGLSPSPMNSQLSSARLTLVSTPRLLDATVSLKHLQPTL